MFIRQQFKTVAGKRRGYWALVESVRTERGRQMVVSWLGALDEAGRLGMLQAARNLNNPPSLKHNQAEQLSLFEYDDEPVEPKWIEVDSNKGRLLAQNTRASHLFDVQVKDKDTDKKYALIEWTRIKPATDWHELSDGCYRLRTNVRDWSGEELWKAYIQLTEAENAFRMHTSDLSIRPVWHQKEDR